MTTSCPLCWEGCACGECAVLQVGVSTACMWGGWVHTPQSVCVRTLAHVTCEHATCMWVWCGGCAPERQSVCVRLHTAWVCTPMCVSGLWECVTMWLCEGRHECAKEAWSQSHRGSRWPGPARLSGRARFSLSVEVMGPRGAVTAPCPTVGQPPSARLAAAPPAPPPLPAGHPLSQPQSSVLTPASLPLPSPFPTA